VLQIAGGPQLVLHPENARDLFRAQQPTPRSAATDADAAPVEVTSQLRWRGLEAAAPTRGAGFLGDAVLQALHIRPQAADTAADFAASAVVRKMDGAVEAGVYTLDPAELTPLKGSGRRLDTLPAADGAVLVLIHGTFSTTAGTFGKLWQQHPDAVRTLFDAYAGRVYALDHPTLGASPIANALTLVQALPAGTQLHLLTHSRGGLVAEVLVRVCGGTADGFADAPPGQAQELAALAKLAAERRIAVERVVRVACPARGTLLASKRLDAYLSVLAWGLQLAGIPALPELVGFIGEVARRRADPALLPGLAAMLPDSPLVRWLNAAPEPLTGDLRVIAGDLQGDSVGGWLKTLLADAYYWTDNDLVVQTRSMYGGAPRRGGASFLLDQGGAATHFAYFANERTAGAVVGALTQPEPAGFKPIGPLSWSGESSTGLRGASRSADASSDAAKPAVFVLPGILGSNLAANGARVWLGPRIIGGLELLRWGGGADVREDGPIGMVYGDLVAYLSATHEVVPFGYDWRAPVEQEARRLGAAVQAALDARAASGQPVRIVAHSMGGVLARTMQLECADVWQRMIGHERSRFLMLGTPNGGSWAPMQVLSGDDTFGNTLAAFGSPLQDHAARMLMAGMPGFLQLQAGLDDAQGLGSEATWQKLADADLAAVRERNWWHGYAGEAPEAAYRWGVPPQAVLDQARALRLRLDQQRDTVLPAFAERTLLVVGHAKQTPAGYELNGDGVVYLDAVDGGDGRVPLTSARLAGVKTWRLGVSHGDLPSTASAFEAYAELLEQGDTTKLERCDPSPTRALVGTMFVRNRPSRGRLPGVPADSERAVFTPPGAAPAEPQPPSGAALRVTVLNGNLAFVTQPLLVGHYRSHTLTGTEAAVDRSVGGAMKASLAAGRYPEQPGSAQVFVQHCRDADNPWRAARAQNVVVVGLGDEGRLRERELAASARQGAIAWAERVAQSAEGGTHFELAATLMGSGGIGVHASTSARAIAQGVRDANDFLVANGWPLVSRLVLVELYLERASDAWRGLQILATSTPGRIEVDATIASGNGALRRPIDSGYRGTDYDFVTATTPAGGGIAFTLDSKRARTELRALAPQSKLVRELVQRGGSAASQDPQLGRTLFQLLVPPEIEPFLGGTGRMLIELDDGTAPIPWELLDTPEERRSGGDPRPWAIRSQLLRKLRTATYRQQVHDAGVEDSALVIGEPLIDDPRYSRLPGALAEAKAVARALGGPRGMAAERLTALVERDDAPTIVGALFTRRYRIVHIAGHGEPGADGGLVMSGGTFLGPREVQAMRTVPELVFVNCCHGAAREAAQALQDRPAFAAGIADALIAIGVRCVIAAGWAVDDAPAALFATTFYRALLDGATFIDAAARAREAAWQQGGNTWAAYQCYGDPTWTLRAGDGASQRTTPAEEYDGVSSPLGVALALEELAVQSRWQGAPAAQQRARIGHLETRFGALWGGMGAVAEAFGLAHAEAQQADAAIAWYERARHANDGSASMKVAERLGNLIARRAWARVQQKTDAASLAAARADIERAVALLDRMVGLSPSVERLSLLGSAWKRRAMLERRAGDAAAERDALAKTIAAYGQALEQAADATPGLRIYPAMNRLGAELVLRITQPATASIDAATWQTARAAIEATVEQTPDFWSVVSLTDLVLFEAVAERRLAAAQSQLSDGYAEVQGRVPAAPHWQTVADQADFVLTPYLETARRAEAQAAREVLALLRRYAA
jgi:tetratricopeptide (TPR) repeat protein